jgi:hypothetical protein
MERLQMEAHPVRLTTSRVRNSFGQENLQSDTQLCVPISIVMKAEPNVFSFTAAEARSSPNNPAQNATATTPNSGAKRGKGAGVGKGGVKGNNNNAEKGRRQDGGKDSGAANGRNGGKGAGKDKKEEPAPRKPSIDLNLASFPPLGAVDDTPVPTPGYKGPFLKYSGDDIIAIAKGVKEAKLPASLNPVRSTQPCAWLCDRF